MSRARERGEVRAWCMCRAEGGEVEINYFLGLLLYRGGPAETEATAGRVTWKIGKGARKL